MKSNHETSDSATPTFGQLCKALAEEALPAAIEDGFYIVRRGDLKRFMGEAPGERTPMLLESLLREPIQVAS